MNDGLAPGLHPALLQDRAILLDLAADRYRMVGTRGASALSALADGLASDDDAVVRALRSARILVPGGSPISPPITIDLDGASSAPKAEASRLGRLIVLWRLLEMRLRLKTSGLATTLAWARRRRAARPTRNDVEASVALGTAFRAVRDGLPIRRRCLPDSLALHSLLGDRGSAATVAIGVRIDPFAAHAWVRSGTALLGDEVDIVRTFTTIFEL